MTEAERNRSFADSFKELVIITGTNLGMKDNEGRENSLLRDRSFRKEEAFTLSSEVQRALVENFLPPISSSTMPGNPGRIIVSAADILNSAASKM